MKKALSLLLAVSFLALMIVSVTGCNLFKPIDIDEVKTTLKNAGYTVTVMTGDEYVETDGAVAAIGAYELEKYLYAVKGEDVIHIFFFVDISTASFNSDFINFDNMLGGHNNEVIYRGTRQAIKDAGL